MATSACVVATVLLTQLLILVLIFFGASWLAGNIEFSMRTYKISTVGQLTGLAALTRMFITANAEGSETIFTGYDVKGYRIFQHSLTITLKTGSSEWIIVASENGAFFHDSDRAVFCSQEGCSIEPFRKSAYYSAYWTTVESLLATRQGFVFLEYSLLMNGHISIVVYSSYGSGLLTERAVPSALFETSFDRSRRLKVHAALLADFTGILAMEDKDSGSIYLSDRASFLPSQNASKHCFPNLIPSPPVCPSSSLNKVLINEAGDVFVYIQCQNFRGKALNSAALFFWPGSSKFSEGRFLSYLFDVAFVSWRDVVLVHNRTFAFWMTNGPYGELQFRAAEIGSFQFGLTASEQALSQTLGYIDLYQYNKSAGQGIILASFGGIFKAYTVIVKPSFILYEKMSFDKGAPLHVAVGYDRNVAVVFPGDPGEVAYLKL